MTQRVHAFTDDALGDLDATGVAEAIAARQISATEAVDAAIARSEVVDPTLHAILRPDFERARRRSGQERAGAFAGVPSAFKDNIQVAGMAMTEGSQAVPTTPAAKNGVNAAQLLRTGMIPIGTTTMPEFGWTCSTETRTITTRNPWNTDVSAGGSSGGSAALVASGVLPIAHGNDGGGSIRIPAGACGLVGLKPTRGRLRTSETARTMPVRIVSDSVLTRSVRDTARLFAEAEKVHRNRTLRPIGLVDRPVSRRLKIGLMIDSPVAPATSPQVRDKVEQTAKLLERLGHWVQPFEVKMPNHFVDDFSAYWAFLAYMASQNGDKMFGKGFDRTKLEPLSVELAKRGRKALPKMPVHLSRLLASSAVSRAQFRGGPDVVLSPVLTDVMPELGYLGPDVDGSLHFARLLDLVGFTPLANATGAPAMSLPVGLDDRGVPVGAMFSATHGDERTLLELALQIEQAQPFDRIQD